MKRSTLATVIAMAGALALAAQLGCAKEKSDSDKTPASETAKSETPAATAVTKTATAGAVASAKLLVMKFHHDN